MDNDTRLYDALEQNNFIKDEQRVIINNYLQVIKTIYDKYDVNYTFDGILGLIQNLKVVEGTANEGISYDKNNNILILGKSPENVEFNTIKSLLQLTSQSYDEETKKYNSGLVITNDGVEYGTKINDLFTDRLITIMTGYSKEDESEVTKINALDTVLMDIQKIVDASSLVTYYAYGKGNMLFDVIAEYINESNAIQFYKCIDNYESNPILNQRIYDLCINGIMQKKLSNENQMPKM